MSAIGRVLTSQVAIEDPHALSLAASHDALTLLGTRSARSATTVVPADEVNAAARPRQPAAVWQPAFSSRAARFGYRRLHRLCSLRRRCIRSALTRALDHCKLGP